MKQRFLLFLTTILFVFNVSAQSLNFLSTKAATGEPLSAEQAFPLEIDYKEGELEILFDIVYGHYLYKDKIKLEINGKEEVLNLPEGSVIDDTYFGKTSILSYGFLVNHENKNTHDKTLDIKVSYQGCAKELNLCYPVRIEKTLFENKEYRQSENKTNIVNANPLEDTKSKLNKENDIEKTNELSIVDLAQTNNIAEITNFLKTTSVLTASFVFILIGVFVAFTPCVYPMMPLIIATTNNSKNPKTAAVSYIFGTILAYATIGLLVGLLNINVQFIVQNKWFVYGVSTLLLLAALYLLGVFNVVFSNNINTWINQKIMEVNPDKNRNQIIIGFLSSLLLSPCSIAPLLGVLVFISQMDAPIYGSFLLAMLAVGIGIPLFLLTTSFNKFMPKSGAWMSEVKNIMALVLYLLAVYIGARGFGDLIYTGLLANGVFVYGLHLIGLNRKQMTGVILSIISILFFLFNSNALNQLEHTKSNKNKSSSSIELIEVSDKEGLNSVIKNANKPVFVDFYADWCITCVRLENTVLKDEKIINLLNKNFLVVKIDLTEISQEEQSLMDEREILAVPYYLFVDSEKNETIYTGELTKTAFEEVLRKTMGQSNDR